MTRIMITGASGFLGRALVHAAKAQGLSVVALSRNTGSNTAPKDSDFHPVQVDLGAPDAPERLKAALVGVEVIIHAAASFSGTTKAHARDTLAATEHLVAGMSQMETLPRLILISSLSVYDVANLTDHATLDETASLVSDSHARDAYAAAKAAQEHRVAGYDGSLHIIRPGAIFGPNRLWSAQLGFVKAGRVFCPGPKTLMPAIHVDRAAQAILRAATHADTNTGEAKVTNLIEPAQPTCKEWLTAIGLKVVPVPSALVHLVGSLTGRRASWRARFRPLVYDTTQAERLLDPATYEPFAQQIARAKQAEQDMQ